MKWFLLIVCGLSLMVGCSREPSESTMAIQIEQQINQQFGVEFVNITNFHKTNGKKDGDGEYIANVEYDIVFTKDVDEVAINMIYGEQQSTLSNSEAAVRDVLAGVGAIGLQMAFGKFKKGDKKHIKSTQKFAKWDDGWLLIE